ncbi:MAG: hypothetical protein U9O18_10325 [Chloroflexota bacterium]|nr:hypothetical protein [Chloroflexota bacterium]
MTIWAGLALILAAAVVPGPSPPEQPWSGAEPITPIANPVYLETAPDDPYGVTLTRISDEEVFGISGSAMQHQYSKVQAWNADMSLIRLGTRFTLDAEDYGLMPELYEGQTDSRWSNVDPDIVYYGDGTALKRMDVRTGQETVLHEFPGFGRVTIGPWEGNLTADDRYVVVTSMDLTKAAVYDIENGEVLSTREFPGTFDWVSMDPWGDYVVVSHNGTGDTRLFDLDFDFVRVLSEVQSHADFAIDSEGNKVFVEMCPLRMVRIADGVETDLLPPTEQTACNCRETDNDPWVCGHVSARSFDMPGWALISAGTDECNDGEGGYYNNSEIFFIKLDGSGTVRLLGHSRTDFADYEAEAKAVVSPDGTKVLFTSNWNVDGDGGDTLDYIIEIDAG